MKNTTDLFITDLPSRVSGGFKPAKGVGRGWVSVPFEAEGNPAVSGVGLATGYASGAPELTIKLGLEGTYVLYLALGCGDSIRAWLDGEDGFRECVTQHGGHKFQEVRLHASDLTGKRLHVAPIPATTYRDHDAHTFLAYVRAVRTDYAPTKSARNLIATNDGYSWIAIDGMTSVRDVAKQFVPYRDSDFFRMLWCPTGADVSGNHLSRVGTTTPFSFNDAYRRCDREFAMSTRRVLKRDGKDVLKAAVKAARDVGMEFQFYIRPEAFYAPFPYDGAYTSKFLQKNPKLRCRDEFGNQIMRMSYAFPRVQDHMLEYVEELLKYDPDGINLAFNRSLPMMICEQPVVDAFKKKHGRLPRLPEEVDAPEMLAVRHEILAGFLQRLHALLAKKKKALSCIADFDENHTRLMGLDLDHAVASGLMESVCVTGLCPTSAYWGKMRDRGDTKIYSSIHYTHTVGLAAPDPYNHQCQAKVLKEVLDAGFAGTFWWDTESMHVNPWNWIVLRHGGNRKFLDRVLAKDPAAAPTLRTIKTLRGQQRGRYDPMRSY